MLLSLWTKRFTKIIMAAWWLRTISKFTWEKVKDQSGNSEYGQQLSGRGRFVRNKSTTFASSWVDDKFWINQSRVQRYFRDEPEPMVWVPSLTWSYSYVFGWDALQWLPLLGVLEQAAYLIKVKGQPKKLENEHLQSKKGFLQKLQCRFLWVEGGSYKINQKQYLLWCIFIPLSPNSARR